MRAWWLPSSCGFLSADVANRAAIFARFLFSSQSTLTATRIYIALHSELGCNVYTGSHIGKPHRSPGFRDDSLMPRKKIDFDTVRKIALGLPDVEESTAYGSMAFKVHGKLLACTPTNKAAEPDSLMVRIDFDDRAELLAAAPDVYYVTDHYLGYSAVLVRLSCVRQDVLRDLLGMAHKFVTAHAPRRLPSRNRRKPV